VLARAYQLAQAFDVLVRERPGENRLQVWLAQATGSGIEQLTGFARSIVDRCVT
jgi:hypothetical protein